MKRRRFSSRFGLIHGTGSGCFHLKRENANQFGWIDAIASGIIPGSTQPRRRQLHGDQGRRHEQIDQLRQFRITGKRTPCRDLSRHG